MTNKILNPKNQIHIIYNLGFEILLDFGIWDLEF